ncbi:MAG: SDR family oxidoreductase [Alphaproteobacteria bacterium]|nr:SDR family oxidoreductase [Alphaproteobacteria bacterium]MBV9825155.1 SDR family oxidoreductase [Alphaproteobacteria bacterium]
MDLAQRNAIVTGPAKGMGRAITLALARAGADLVLCGRDLAPINDVAAEVRSLGHAATVLACDVRSAESVEAMVAGASEAFAGRIDILVNVAGGTGPIGAPSWETTPEQFDEIIAVNTKGCFLTMRAVMPLMIEQRYGKIVNVGGTFGLRGQAGRMAYSASKWGLRGITKSAALECGPYNVNINNVCPAMVEGERFETVCAERARRLGTSRAEARQFYESQYALRRISEDRDIAEAVLFLCSDRARQITGIDLPVDGGSFI